MGSNVIAFYRCCDKKTTKCSYCGWYITGGDGICGLLKMYIDDTFERERGETFQDFDQHDCDNFYVINTQLSSFHA